MPGPTGVEAPVDVPTRQREIGISPSIGRDEFRGFGLNRIPAVLDGRGDGVADRARTARFPRDRPDPVLARARFEPARARGPG